MPREQRRKVAVRTTALREMLGQFLELKSLGLDERFLGHRCSRQCPARKGYGDRDRREGGAVGSGSACGGSEGRRAEAGEPWCRVRVPACSRDGGTWTVSVVSMASQRGHSAKSRNESISHRALWGKSMRGTQIQGENTVYSVLPKHVHRLAW